MDLATPLYGPAEVGRLLGIDPSRVSRWLRGYRYRSSGGTRPRSQPPVVRRHQGPDEPAASFLDLMELHFVKGFLDTGISLQRVRRACEEAQRLFRVDHPFSRRRFFADGRSIYVEAGRSGAHNLLELLSGGQWVIAPVVLSQAKMIEFDGRTGLARRWWPRGRTGGVVLDPRVCFGAPTIPQRGIKTAVVYDLYVAEKRNVRAVASWMDLAPDEVTRAVQFEASLAA